MFEQKSKISKSGYGIVWMKKKRFLFNIRVPKYTKLVGAFIWKKLNPSIY